MQQYNAIDGQSLHDVCLNTYGTLDNFYRLLQDNNILNADAYINTGQAFSWDDSLQNSVQSGITYATDLGEIQRIMPVGILTESGLFILSETDSNILTT